MLRHFVLGMRFRSDWEKQQRVSDAAALHVGPLAARSLVVQVDIEHRSAPIGYVLRRQRCRRGCAERGLKELPAECHFRIGLNLMLRNSIRLSGWHCRPMTPEACALSRTSRTGLPFSAMTKWSPSAFTSYQFHWSPTTLPGVVAF